MNRAAVLNLQNLIELLLPFPLLFFRVGLSNQQGRDA
jgi:uncharacterized membrane protein